jgi:hypothetical protein
MQQRGWVAPLALLSALLTLFPAANPAAEASPNLDYARGQALFRGDIELSGRIRFHLEDLPSAVIRCSNCHAAGTEPDVPRSLAPRLTHDLLLAPRARRGGPASRYDRAAFCTLLQQGIDPAHVVVSVEMPLYMLSEQDCHALWRYITGGTHAATAP